MQTVRCESCNGTQDGRRWSWQIGPTVTVAVGSRVYENGWYHDDCYAALTGDAVSERPKLRVIKGEK